MVVTAFVVAIWLARSLRGPLHVDLALVDLGSEAAQKKAARLHATRNAAHKKAQQVAGVHHQYERRKANRNGQPEPVSPLLLRPELRHEEPVDPF